MRYLLDTNVISELVAARPNKDVLDWLDSVDPDDVLISVITIGEIRKGIEKQPASTRKERLQKWLHEDLLSRFADHILSLDVEAMLLWGEMMGRLEKSGTSPAVDSMVSALALLHRCTLVTRNTGHFQNTGVTLLNPWLSGAT